MDLSERTAGAGVVRSIRGRRRVPPPASRVQRAIRLLALDATGRRIGGCPRHRGTLTVVAGVRFDSEADAWWLPSRQWVAAWLEGARAYWPLVLRDYRDRVGKYYDDQARDSPDAFPLMRPTRIVVVVSLLRAWVFAARAEVDEVEVREMWEDPILANWDTLHAPNLDSQVRAVAGLSSDLELIDSEDVHQLAAGTKGTLPTSVWENRRIPGLGMFGWDLADRHDLARRLNEDFAKVRGYGMNRARLRELAGEFGILDAMDDEPNARGLKLEPFIRELLAAHGFEVEKGKHREGEQVDLIVHRPIRALVECRWYADPVGRAAITELIGKLTRDRPAIVSGIYVSMSGFTAPARTEARAHARDRVVVLLDRVDVLRLLHGQQHARELVDERIDELVRRYDS